MHLVADLIKKTVEEKRTNQKFILLEGLCNSGKLSNDEEKLELRFMDELFLVEKDIGEIAAVISLQYHEDQAQFTEDKWEEFSEPEVQEEKPEKNEDDDDEEEDEPPVDDDEEEKKPVENVKDFKWTITNGRPKNLLQLFMNIGGIQAHHNTINANTLCQGQTE